VLVVAHRGSSLSAPEHSYAAYVQAVEEGADGLECDVRLTRDGHLVCVHDRRVDRVSSGRGVVSTLELADLADLDFGVSKRAEDPAADLAGDGDAEEPDVDRSGVLTLERLIELCVDSRTPSGRPVQLYVETKHPTRYAGRVERRLVDLLSRYGLDTPPVSGPPQVSVLSFSAIGLRRIHAMAPALPTVYVLERVPLRYRDGSLPARVSGVGVSIDAVRAYPDYVRKVQDRGYTVSVWIVDADDDLDLVHRLGVDAVLTKRPGYVRKRFGMA
jgi:glycerophosphoryl diester phosphodiesterase